MALTLSKRGGRPRAFDRRSGRHLSKTHEYGSPPWMSEGARYIFNAEIDVDPASSPKWNQIVRARRILTKREDALNPKTSWSLPGVRRSVVIFHNPPGDPLGLLVPAFWSRLLCEWRSGIVLAALWVGFSLEQWRTLQGPPLHPLELPTVIPRARVPYYELRNGVPTESKAPSHATYLTLLPPATLMAERARMIRRFAEAFGTRGKLLNT